MIMLSVAGNSQEFSKAPTVTLFTGLMNYQGDLKPNSFTFEHSNFTAGLILRKPVTRWFTVRAGITVGKIEAADRYNRGYLKKRNLSFFTSMQEVHTGIEWAMLDISSSGFTPYMYGGLAVFHFNPWTYDNSGDKVFLKPLNTEGQGLSEFPRQKTYGLMQIAIPFGIGFRYAVTDNIRIGVEFSQRKSFTDYIDDVSTHYVDASVLRKARGSKAAELAYRSDEVIGGAADYPAHGEQRGTPSEMDWYYFFGTMVEIKLQRVVQLFQSKDVAKRSYHKKCPNRF